tara:strand:+ start:650 stop:1234 length:585 start_codon:yes stop_codon:yes gene_type:complete
MTPRLRMLSIGLALSLSYAIYDYVDRNSDKKPVVTKSKEKKRARTAGVSASRAENLKKKIARRKAKLGGSNNTAKTTKSTFKPESDFLPISDEINELEGWARNPFVEVYEPKQISRNIAAVDQEAEIEEQAGLTTLDGLIIETAVRMGEKAFVTINGQTFREGDQINDALIEKIENEQITFKVGKTRIIKDVGT